MSRNKQIDRLREGLEVFNGSGKVKDPVEYVLNLLKNNKQSAETMEQSAVFTENNLRAALKENNELFEALHNELVYAGLRSGTVITCDNSSVDLGRLGFKDSPNIDTMEDKVRLITIIGMVINHFRDLVLKERKIGAKTLKDAQEAAQSLLDSSYLTNTTFRTTLKDQDRALAECHRIIKDKDEERTYNLEVIKQLTGELEYQVAATKQYKRELELLHKDDIERSVNVAKFIFKD